MEEYSQGKIMVKDLPKDDPAFIRAELNDMFFLSSSK